MSILKKINTKISIATLLVFFIITVVLSFMNPPPEERTKFINGIKLLFEKNGIWDDENGEFMHELFYEVNNVHYEDFDEISDLDLSALHPKVQERISILDPLSKNYEPFDRFVAHYKNTILGWFGKKRDLSKNFYIEKRTDKFEYYLMYFASILPYIPFFLLFSFYLSLVNKNKS